MIPVSRSSFCRVPPGMTVWKSGTCADVPVVVGDPGFIHVHDGACRAQTNANPRILTIKTAQCMSANCQPSFALACQRSARGEGRVAQSAKLQNSYVLSAVVFARKRKQHEHFATNVIFVATLWTLDTQLSTATDANGMLVPT